MIAETPIRAQPRQRSPCFSTDTVTNTTGGANNRYSYPKRPHRISTKISLPKRLTDNEGQVTDFDTSTGLYTIKFDNVIESGWTCDKITLAKPRNQQKTIATLSGAYNNHIYAPNFFPKASPSTNYASAKDVEERDYSAFIQTFNANLWDPTLKIFASFKDFLDHPDPAIQNCWLCFGKNEYHRLSKDGMDVLKWICHSDVPRLKMGDLPLYCR